MRRGPSGPGRRVARAAGVVCIGAGAWLLADAGWLRGRSFVWQEMGAWRLGRLTPGDVGESPLPSPDASGRGASSGRLSGVLRSSAARAYKRGEPVARLRVPRIGLDSVVAEGTDRATLRLGPGHLEGSALPGGRDNCIIAGHRDGAFALLKSVRPGDTVEVIGTDGTHRYRVLHIRIVPKEDTSVLRSTERPLLTLITCYPFDYVGPAPNRLVVIGEMLGADGPG